MIQLDFFHRHDVSSGPNREKLAHELLDLNYTIIALLLGGRRAVKNESCYVSDFSDPTV